MKTFRDTFYSDCVRIADEPRIKGSIAHKGAAKSTEYMLYELLYAETIEEFIEVQNYLKFSLHLEEVKI